MVAGPEPRREHLEVLEVRAGITGRLHAVLFEDARNVVGGNPQFGRSVATALEFLRRKICDFFAKFVRANGRQPDRRVSAAGNTQTARATSAGARIENPFDFENPFLYLKRMKTEISFCPTCAGKLDVAEDDQFQCEDCETKFYIQIAEEGDDDDEDEEEEDDV